MRKQKNKADNSCSFTDFIPQRPEYISNIIINDIETNFNPNIHESLYIPTWKREEMAEEYFRR